MIRILTLFWNPSNKLEPHTWFSILFRSGLFCLFNLEWNQLSNMNDNSIFCIPSVPMFHEMWKCILPSLMSFCVYFLGVPGSRSFSRSEYWKRHQHCCGSTYLTGARWGKILCLYFGFIAMQNPIPQTANAPAHLRDLDSRLPQGEKQITFILPFFYT